MHDSSEIDDLVRRTDPDRWLSSRFVADREARADVVALYAFDGELARAPRATSNPLMGEIRLTWWREALDEIYAGRPPRRHPTVQALAGVIGRHGLAREFLELMIDARYRELDPAPMAEDEALLWARDTGGQVAELAAGVLDPEGAAQHAVEAGAVWALGRRGLAFEVAAAKADARRLSPAAFPAVAHAALVMHPAKTEFGKRLWLTWAVARGRL